MTTVKQIERSWKLAQYERLFHQLAELRPEARIGTGVRPTWVPAAAAMAIIRIDELGQSQAPLYATLIRAILTSQQADGGWGDIALTALCSRALLCGQGNGIAVERGLAYLANLQKPDGIWPNVPIRRMPEDAVTSALVLYELGDQSAFHSAVRIDDALTWFDRNEARLDPDARELLQRARLRSQLRKARAQEFSWLAA